jgi:hypothetical protein
MDSDPAVESDDDSQIQEKPAMEDQARETTMRRDLEVQLTKDGWYTSKMEIFKDKHGLKTMRVVPEHERPSFFEDRLAASSLLNEYEAAAETMKRVQPKSQTKLIGKRAKTEEETARITYLSLGLNLTL